VNRYKLKADLNLQQGIEIAIVIVSEKYGVSEKIWITIKTKLMELVSVA